MQSSSFNMKTKIGISIISLCLSLFFFSAPITDFGLGKNADHKKTIQPYQQQSTIPPAKATTLSLTEINSMFYAETKEQPPLITAQNAPKQQKYGGDLRRIGIIQDDDNIKRIYFKDIQTGTIIRVRQDGTMENGLQITNNDTEVIITGTTYRITGEQ